MSRAGATLDEPETLTRLLGELVAVLAASRRALEVQTRVLLEAQRALAQARKRMKRANGTVGRAARADAKDEEALDKLFDRAEREAREAGTFGMSPARIAETVTRVRAKHRRASKRSKR